MNNRGSNFGRDAGFASVIAMVMMVLVTTLALTMTVASNLSLQQADNTTMSCDARLQAESGVAFFADRFRAMSLPSSTPDDEILQHVADFLADDLDGSGNLAAQSVTLANGVISVPRIDYNDAGDGFNGRLTHLGNGTVRLLVAGWSGDKQKLIQMDFNLTDKESLAFQYGVASKGPIGMWGHSQILGVNDPSEADILSALPSGEAIRLRGNVTVDGDLAVSGDHAYVSLGGNSNSVGGSEDTTDILNNHVHLGVEEPEFPEIDTSVFEPFATNVIDSSFKKLNGGTYTNIRIAANTNPSFGKSAVINGVVYIESPNVVTFKSDTEINGVIVTEEGTGGADCEIEFRSTVTANPVETLPDTAEFAGLKDLGGTFLLAPGFAVSLKGQANSFNGTIAADKIDLRGNSSLTAHGFVLGLSSRELTMHGNCRIYVNQTGVDRSPAGFKHPRTLSADADSYTELAQGATQ